MKKILLMVIMLLSLNGVCSASDGNNIGVDRFAHFGIQYVICDQLHRNAGMNKFWAGVTTLAIGAAKEAFIDDHWDGGDFAADCAGAFFSITF